MPVNIRGLNSPTLWGIYIATVVIVYALLAFLLSLPVPLSLFLALLVGIAIVGFVPKEISTSHSRTSYITLAAISSFLLIASAVWLLIYYYGAIPSNGCSVGIFVKQE